MVADCEVFKAKKTNQVLLYLYMKYPKNNYEKTKGWVTQDEIIEHTGRKEITTPLGKLKNRPLFIWDSPRYGDHLQELQKGNIPEKLREKFEEIGHELKGDIQLREDDGKFWICKKEGKEYSIEAEEDEFHVNENWIYEATISKLESDEGFKVDNKGRVHLSDITDKKRTKKRRPNKYYRIKEKKLSKAEEKIRNIRKKYVPFELNIGEEKFRFFSKAGDLVDCLERGDENEGWKRFLRMLRVKQSPGENNLSLGNYCVKIHINNEDIGKELFNTKREILWEGEDDLFEEIISIFEENEESLTENAELKKVGKERFLIEDQNGENMYLLKQKDEGLSAYLFKKEDKILLNIEDLSSLKIIYFKELKEKTNDLKLDFRDFYQELSFTTEVSEDAKKKLKKRELTAELKDKFKDEIGVELDDCPDIKKKNDQFSIQGDESTFRIKETSLGIEVYVEEGTEFEKKSKTPMEHFPIVEGDELVNEILSLDEILEDRLNRGSDLSEKDFEGVFTKRITDIRDYSFIDLDLLDKTLLDEGGVKQRFEEAIEEEKPFLIEGDAATGKTTLALQLVRDLRAKKGFDINQEFWVYWTNAEVFKNENAREEFRMGLKKLNKEDDGIKIGVVIDDFHKAEKEIANLFVSILRREDIPNPQFIFTSRRSENIKEVNEKIRQKKSYLPLKGEEKKKKEREVEKRTELTLKDEHDGQDTYTTQEKKGMETLEYMRHSERKVPMGIERLIETTVQFDINKDLIKKLIDSINEQLDIPENKKRMIEKIRKYEYNLIILKEIYAYVKKKKRIELGDWIEIGDTLMEYEFECAGIDYRNKNTAKKCLLWIADLQKMEIEVPEEFLTYRVKDDVRPFLEKLEDNRLLHKENGRWRLYHPSMGEILSGTVQRDITGLRVNLDYLNRFADPKRSSRALDIDNIYWVCDTFRKLNYEGILSLNESNLKSLERVMDKVSRYEIITEAFKTWCDLTSSNQERYKERFRKLFEVHIRDLLQHPDKEVIKITLEMLGSVVYDFPDESIKKSVVGCLDHYNPTVRKQSLEVLSTFVIYSEEDSITKDEVKKIVRCIKDEDRSIREEAIYTLDIVREFCEKINFSGDRTLGSPFDSLESDRAEENIWGYFVLTDEIIEGDKDKEKLTMF